LWIETGSPALANHGLELSMVEPDPRALLTAIQKDIAQFEGYQDPLDAFGTLHRADGNVERLRAARQGFQSPAQSSRVKYTS
jgi:hypothetical protein